MRRDGPASAARDSTSKSRSRHAPSPPRRRRSPSPRPGAAAAPPPPRAAAAAAPPPPAAGASSIDTQLAEECARLALIDLAALTAKREASQRARDETTATFELDAAAEKDGYARAAGHEQRIVTLRRVLARALASGGGEAPGLDWVCSALKAGCPCREGVARLKDAFPVDASWFRPNDAHGQLARLFDEALQAYEEAVAAGRDDDAKAALLKLEGDKEATPKLTALRKALCAACRLFFAERTANARAAGDAVVLALKVTKYLGEDCASDYPCGVNFATRELVAAICTFQHTKESDPKPPGAHGPGGDEG
jgi:hypothetical protein